MIFLVCDLKHAVLLIFKVCDPDVRLPVIFYAIEEAVEEPCET